MEEQERYTKTKTEDFVKYLRAEGFNRHPLHGWYYHQGIVCEMVIVEEWAEGWTLGVVSDQCEPGKVSEVAAVLTNRATFQDVEALKAIGRRHPSGIWGR